MEIPNDCERSAECRKTVGVCIFFSAFSRGLRAGDRDRLVAFLVQNLVPESC